MQLKAVIKGNRIKFLEGEYNFPVPVLVEVNLPDENLLLRREHPATRNIRKLMGNISSGNFDWKEEWQEHLEEKYGS